MLTLLIALALCVSVFVPMAMGDEGVKGDDGYGVSNVATLTHANPGPSNGSGTVNGGSAFGGRGEGGSGDGFGGGRGFGDGGKGGSVTPNDAGGIEVKGGDGGVGTFIIGTGTGTGGAGGGATLNDATFNNGKIDIKVEGGVGGSGEITVSNPTHRHWRLRDWRPR